MVSIFNKVTTQILSSLECSEEAQKKPLPVWSGPGKATQSSCLPAGPRGAFRFRALHWAAGKTALIL